jgi:hypothetical protein
MKIFWSFPEYLEYSNLCYNDIQPLYLVRNLNKRNFPYVQQKDYEYPVVTGLFMWVLSLFTEDPSEFFNANACTLAILALLSTIALIKALGQRRSIFWFAAGSPLLLYAFMNWDLIPVCCVCLALWAWKRGSLIWTGVSLGVGISAKIYPLFLVLPLLVMLWRMPEQTKKNRYKNISIFIFSIFTISLILNIPVMFADYWYSGNIDGWLNVFKFHLDRTADIWTFPFWIQAIKNNMIVPDIFHYIFPLLFGGLTFWLMGMKLKSPERRKPLLAVTISLTCVFLFCAFSDKLYPKMAEDISEFIFIAGNFALLTNQWIRNKGPWCTGGAVLALYLLVSKIYSPQHTLWLIPLMVAIDTPSTILIGYFISDIIVLVANFYYQYWWRKSSTFDTNVFFWEYISLFGVSFRALFMVKFVLHCAFEGKDRLKLGGWYKKKSLTIAHIDAAVKNEVVPET